MVKKLPAYMTEILLGKGVKGKTSKQIDGYFCFLGDFFAF
jgi:hypothetical protein